jgi:hypothetical protein
MELKTHNDIKESKLIRESLDVEELLVTQCPPNASDAQILQRIRSAVAAARRTHRYEAYLDLSRLLCEIPHAR